MVKNAFILYAHQDNQSFNFSLKNVAQEYFQKSGWKVEVSDLYQMKFDPVASPQDFSRESISERFKYSREQVSAVQENRLRQDILKEQKKLLNADLFIVQFPMWWYGMPAILKGWFDRVLTKGSLYCDGQIYDRGIFKGKRTLITMTTGGTPNPTVRDEDIEQIVNYWNHGILYFLGFEVLDPFIVFSPSALSKSKRTSKLEDYRKYLENLENTQGVPYKTLEKSGQSHQLKCIG